MESADDIVEEFGWPRAGEMPGADGSSDAQSSTSGDPLLRLMHAGQAYDLDALAEISGVDGVRLLPRLLELELHRLGQRIDGGRFMRRRRTC